MSITTTLIALGLAAAVAGCIVVPSSSSGGYATQPPPGPPGQAAPAQAPEEGLAYCSSSIDCGAGEFCKDRGDGLKLCMGHGDRSDYCSSSIDCGAGMFCKDRGDGLKICM